MNENKKSFPDLHVHAQDAGDCGNKADDICRRYKELNAPGFALTQHGVLSAIEPMRKATEKYGLKFIPGVEAYYERKDATSTKEHLILLSEDDIGYHAICKAVTDSNDDSGKAVMNDTILEQYFAEGAEGHGHVIATSACIQGVVPMVLRRNEVVLKNIEKAKHHQERYGINPYGNRIQSAKKELADIDARLEELKIKKEQTKRIADMKFGVRERNLNKLKMTNPNGEVTIREEQSLLADKKKAEEAKKDYAELMDESKKISRKRTAVNKAYKELSEKADRWLEDEKAIENYTELLIEENALMDEAISEGRRFEKIFGKGYFFLEVQNHGIDKELEIYPKIAKISKITDIPLVATNDVHTITNSEDELLRRRILRSIRFGTEMEQPKVGDDQLYIKTDREMVTALRGVLSDADIKEAMYNALKIFNRCNVTFEHENHYPVFLHDDDRSAEEILEAEARKGIPWRFPDGFPDERYEERLQYELDIIKSMGYANYHLVVKDYLEYGRELGAVPEDKIDEAPFDIEALKEWKRENGWDVGFSIGPGRGSAVGSLVCYLLGITALDPIKYNLLFERFLNPERVSMPDIDSDFSYTIRQKVIEYVQHKYGSDSVCGILTTNAQAPKGSIRIAAKYYGLEKKNDGAVFLSLGDAIAKKVPNKPGLAFDTEDETGKTLYESLREEYKDNDDALEILRWAHVVEGCFTAYGAHAAGIVISDGTAIKDHIPLRWNKKLNEWTTQMDMISVEENGFLKMDFLGLRTLDIITDCIKEIKKTHGKAIDPLTIPLDDANVYKKIFCEGNTNAVFQFESGGMKNMLQRFEPSCFDDLIILVAMFRPGPMQYLDDVIKVKHGVKPKYITKELEPILKGTYGAIVFQEQVMQIFQELSGYTLGGADQVRRAMSKKKASVLAAERPIFINGLDEEDTDGKKGRHIKGCVKNGISAQAADELFTQMTDFAKYAFNKSHAAVYALIGYYTAWLKYHYPAEFIMAALNWAKIEDFPGLIQEAKKFGVAVNAPDINKSGNKFVVTDGNILFGLGAVKTVGASADEIIAERNKGGEFHSLMEYFARTSIKKNALENLIKAGTFDCFSQNRKGMVDIAEEAQKTAKKLQEYEEKETTLKEELSELNDSLFFFESEDGKKQKASLEKKIQNANARVSELKEKLSQIKPNEDTPEDPLVRMNEERELLGAYVTAHPLDYYPSNRELNVPATQDISTKTDKVYGVIRDLQVKFRKKDNKPMAFFKLEDKFGEIEVCVFVKEYEAMKNDLYEGHVVILEGKTSFESIQKSDEEEASGVYKFFARKLTEAQKKQSGYKMSVPSFYGFCAKELKEFKKKYEVANGHPLQIYDKINGEYRKMTFTVSEETLKLPNVKEA